MLKDYIKTARPNHYIKNLFIFAGLIFSKNFLNIDKIASTLLTFVSFSLAASAVYFLNDLLDKDLDKLHPTKKYRPIASGKISPKNALISYFILATISLGIGLIFVNQLVFYLILSYLIINVLYSWKLKNIVILDIFIVASGFILRIYAGGAAINVLISDWLLLTVLFISLLLVVAKRRNEFINGFTQELKTTRKVIVHYDEKLLDQFIAVISALTVITYSLYTVLSPNIEHLFCTIPVVLYGIFRFLYLVYKENGGSHPEKELINDSHILGSVLVWISLVIIIILI